MRRPRNQLRCDSTRLKIKEEKKTENRAFLTARCHNEGRFSREVSGQDRPQSCRRNPPANLLVRPPLPQQVSPSLGIVRTPEETPANPIPHAERRHRATRWPAPALPRRSLGLGRVGAACPEAERPFASDAARLDHGPADAQPNAGAEEPPTSWREAGETQSQSRRQRQDTVLFLSGIEEQKLRFQGGSHSAALRGSFRLASSKVAGPCRVGAGGAPTSDVGRSHNGQAPPPPSRTLSPNWTVGRSAVERHRLLRVERRPGSYPVLTLILRSRQSPAPSTAPPPPPVRAPLTLERPWSAVRHRNRYVGRAGPRPPNWPAQRPASFVRTGAAVPHPRPAPPVSPASATALRKAFSGPFLR